MNKKVVLSLACAIMFCFCSVFTVSAIASNTASASPASLKIHDMPRLNVMQNGIYDEYSFWMRYSNLSFEDYCYPRHEKDTFYTFEELMDWFNEGENKGKVAAMQHYIKRPADTDKIKLVKSEYSVTYFSPGNIDDRYDYLRNVMCGITSTMLFEIDGEYVTVVSFFNGFTEIVDGELTRISSDDEIKLESLILNGAVEQQKPYRLWHGSARCHGSEYYNGKQTFPYDTFRSAPIYGVVCDSPMFFAILDERPVSNQEKDALEIELAKIINENIAFVEYIPEK